MTSAATLDEAWLQLLNRPFKGLESSNYRERFETEIADPYLRTQALKSLGNAGNDQQFKYDFSYESWANKSQRNEKGKFCNFAKKNVFHDSLQSDRKIL